MEDVKSRNGSEVCRKYISTFGTLALSSLRSGTSILKNRMQVPTSSEGRAVLIYFLHTGLRIELLTGAAYNLLIEIEKNE